VSVPALKRPPPVLTLFLIKYIVLKKRHNQHNALPPFVRVRLFYLSFTMIQ
jgi:hypothetical protein